jgi:hypothetical protein
VRKTKFPAGFSFFVFGQKKRAERLFSSLVRSGLDCSAGNLTGTQATGASVNTLWGTVHNCSHTLHVWLPGSVRTSMRVRNLNTESNIFSTNFTLCHVSAPPSKGLFYKITTLVFYQIYKGNARVFSRFFLTSPNNREKIGETVLFCWSFWIFKKDSLEKE